MKEERTEIRRSMEEITASARMNMQDMINRAIGLGQDCIDAKEILGHGKFLPWLKELGLSSSTASNYMRVAREIQPGSRLASLSYSKALALLNAPADERETLAEEAEGKSAAEIRRLIDERNRAAEAANTETARADAAEADAKRFYDENARLNTERANLEARLEQMKADLLIAENNRVEVEKVVEKVPDDYERIKKQLANMQKTNEDLINAAAEATERAEAAEAELDAIASGSEPHEVIWKTFKMACERFQMETNCMLKATPAELNRDRKRICTDLTLLSSWVRALQEIMDKAEQDDAFAGTVTIV